MQMGQPSCDHRFLPTASAPGYGRATVDQISLGSRPDQGDLADLTVDDVLVLHADEATFRLIGGIGLGAGWADIVTCQPRLAPFMTWLG